MSAAGADRAQAALDLDDDASSKQTIGTIALIAGGAIAAGGVTMLLDQTKGSSDAAGITP